jgi:hypothetical protein
MRQSFTILAILLMLMTILGAKIARADLIINDPPRKEPTQTPPAPAPTPTPPQKVPETDRGGCATRTSDPVSTGLSVLALAAGATLAVQIVRRRPRARN